MKSFCVCVCVLNTTNNWSEPVTILSTKQITTPINNHLKEHTHAHTHTHTRAHTHTHAHTHTNTHKHTSLSSHGHCVCVCVSDCLSIQQCPSLVHLFGWLCILCVRDEPQLLGSRRQPGYALTSSYFQCLLRVNMHIATGNYSALLQHTVV